MRFKKRSHFEEMVFAIKTTTCKPLLVCYSVLKYRDSNNSHDLIEYSRTTRSSTGEIIILEWFATIIRAIAYFKWFFCS